MMLLSFNLGLLKDLNNGKTPQLSFETPDYIQVDNSPKVLPSQDLKETIKGRHGHPSLLTPKTDTDPSVERSSVSFREDPMGCTGKGETQE